MLKFLSKQHKILKFSLLAFCVNLLLLLKLCVLNLSWKPLHILPYLILKRLLRFRIF